MSKTAFMNKVQLQYFDAVEDTQQEDWSYIPIGVISHGLATTTKRTINPKDSTIKLTKEREIRVKTA